MPTPKKLQFWTIHVIVALITLACILMQFVMREGMPLNGDLESRMQFINDAGLVWQLSWLTWMMSAVGLFVFCVVLASYVRPSAARTIGLDLVAIGIAPDLIAEVIFAFVIPNSVRQGVDIGTMHVLENLAVFLTGFLANGLYNVGGLLITMLAFKEGILDRWVFAWGLIAWILGIALSVSIAAGHLSAAELLTAASMVLSTSWMLVIAYRVVR